MLTKRTNILFSETDWQWLTSLASQKKTTVGQLVRHAINKTYQPPVTKRAQTHPLDQAHALTQKHHIKALSPQDISQFIAYGRQ